MKKLKLPIAPLSLLLLTIVGIGVAPVQPYQQPQAYQFDNHDDVQEQLYVLSMDEGVRPCDDFYGYACGNWRSDSPANYQETLTKLDYEIKQKMVKILQTLNRNNVRQLKFPREVYNYYRSCIGTEVPETVGYLRWLEEHEHSLQWPISEQSQSQYYSPRYDWIQMLATLRKYGFNDVLVHESTVPKEMNPNMLTIQLGRPQFEQSHLTELRYDVVTGTLRFFMQQEEYHSLWNDIQDLDRRLLELATQYEQDEEVVFDTVDSLSDVPWLQHYLSVLLDNSNLDPNMELVVTNKPYLKAVAELMQQYDAKFICEYLQVKFLSYLNYKQFQPQYRDCVTSTRLLLPLPTQWLYEQHHPELQHEINSISMLFTNLKRTFHRILSRNVYNLDQSMMKFFMGKLRTLQLRIGFLSSRSLEEFYGNLSLNPNDYYGNRLKIYSYHFKAVHRRLNTRLRRDAYEFLHLEEYDTAKALLPYILSRQRAVVVPLSILQHPYYRPEQPTAYIYSTVGFLMARQLLWEFTITDIDVSAYGQVFSYILVMLIENPQFKMDYDHIANYHRGETEQVDSAISGLKLAYQAFTEDQHDVALTKSFFLNFAQMYCGTPADSHHHRPSHAVINQKIVNMAVSHVGAFSRAYGCAYGPAHGVLYWGHNNDN